MHDNIIGQHGLCRQAKSDWVGSATRHIGLLSRKTGECRALSLPPPQRSNTISRDSTSSPLTRAVR